VDAAARVSQRVRVVGTRQTWRRSVDVRGEFVYFMTLEDLEGFLDVVITSEVYRRYHSAITSPGFHLVEGVVELKTDESEPYIRAEKIERI